MSTVSHFNAGSLSLDYTNDWHPFAPATTILSWGSDPDYNGTGHGGLTNFFGSQLDSFGFLLALVSGPPIDPSAVISSVTLNFRGSGATGGGDALQFALGTNYSVPPTTVNSSGPAFYSYDATSFQPWTPASVLTTPVGLKTFSVNHAVLVYSFWVDVEWDVPVPITYEVAATLTATPALVTTEKVATGGHQEVVLSAGADLSSHTGTGLVIDVPTANRWELQRFAVRPTKQGPR